MIDLTSLFGNVFYGRRVLVTGHTGFKGSWLTLWLNAMGAEVHGYALAPSTSPSMFEAADIQSKMASNNIADIRDHQALLGVVREIEPEVIFHLAAQPLVRHSYREPRETYDTNVMGTVNLLEAVRDVASVRVCQVITSDKCYENREWVYAYRENDPMGGYDPYSNSKGCSELVVSSYRDSFFSNTGEPNRVSLSSTRAGNVIGGGDWSEDRIIPDCVKALSSGKVIEIRNPHAIRPWQHVLEPLSGYLWLAANQWIKPEQLNQGWNFGPTSAGNVDVSQIVSMVTGVWGKGEWNEADVYKDTLHEARFLKLDITKATSLLGWSPVYTVSEAITETVNWYRNYYGCAHSVGAFTMSQIEKYAVCAYECGQPWAVKGESL